MDSEEILTEEEMSALLPETKPEDAAGGERDRRRKIVPYNFRRPDRLSKEQVRSLYLLHDLLANHLSSSLPIFLRAFTEVSLISVEQQAYSEYIRGLSDPTNIFTFSVAELKGSFAIEINSSIAFPIIDRMLGGGGEGLTESRPATDLELKLLEGFLSYVTDDYKDAWKPIVEFGTELTGRETRPQLLQIAPPNEVVIAIMYQIQIGEAVGFMSICLPMVLLESVIEKFNPSSYEPVKILAPEATHALLNNVSAVRFPITAELKESSAMVSDLMSLAIGDVFLTNHKIENPVRINVAGVTKFNGKLTTHDDKLVVQVTQ